MRADLVKTFCENWTRDLGTSRTDNQSDPGGRLSSHSHGALGQALQKSQILYSAEERDVSCIVMATGAP